MSFFAVASVHGELSVEWAAHIEKVCLTIRPSAGMGDHSIQMTLDQALEMRNKLDAAITRVQTTTPCTECGGRGLYRDNNDELLRCEVCVGEGTVPR